MAPRKIKNTMKFQIFEKFSELKYGLSEKEDGFLNSKILSDSSRDGIAQENRRKFFERNEIEGKIFVPYLTHSGNVAIINEKNYQERIKADGFITAAPDIFLTITVADCFPVYFYDPIKKVVGLAHCGWRGITKNIVKNVIVAFKESFLSEPADILMAIGPGIQRCHFTVKEDVIGNFKEYDEFIERNGEPRTTALRGKSYFIDLSGIISKQAKDERIVSIELSGQCVYCDFNKYFSYRRDKPKILEVMMAYIGISL